MEEAIRRSEVLRDLELDDFAAYLHEAEGKALLPTLISIREELSSPFADGYWLG